MLTLGVVAPESLDLQCLICSAWCFTLSVQTEWKIRDGKMNCEDAVVNGVKSAINKASFYNCLIWFAVERAFV